MSPPPGHGPTHHPPAKHPHGHAPPPPPPSHGHHDGHSGSGCTSFLQGCLACLCCCWIWKRCCPCFFH